MMEQTTHTWKVGTRGDSDIEENKDNRWIFSPKKRGSPAEEMEVNGNKGGEERKKEKREESGMITERQNQRWRDTNGQKNR
jgi:hypothetical protein